MASPEQPTVAPPADIGAVNVVETPTSPSSAFTLSRFEFEAGTKGNEGTKILMVEWDARAAIDAAAGPGGADRDGELAQDGCDDDDWDVTWEGKGPDGGSKEDFTVLPIRDTDAPEGTRRVYFLLPPGAPIPTLVTIARRTGLTGLTRLTELRTKPLPAIFPDGLVSESEGKGTRGVLHTIWAKRRLRELDAEVAAEMRDNSESVGLEMVLQERQWIVDHFGLEIDTSSEGAIAPVPQNPDSSSPVSPRSPVGGRLGERLRGLKLATSPAELAAAKEASHNEAKNSAAAERKITAFTPASGGAGLARPAGPGGIASLGAVIEGGAPAPERSVDTEEDLFALPMSPRSPEEAKSPFSMLKC
ncbi:hypothetical protein KVR01_005284 [Diaporthe batatas]|uniref:uncharacterized protein n=1 Tax=Diaporthe batatas TaxID=748121 RepID=UPI001D044624|nr:uncharacterized protein KVR01_005284 [Diaporthe batatas]KAG8165009.1 hypothetical protein KVR01_005284 [Diaporthe batatas]